MTERIPTAEEQRVVAGLSAGDEQVLEQIHEQYGGMVFGFLIRMVGDRGAAEDIHQQVFLEVWSRGASFDPRLSSLISWIMRIARSRAIDHLRKNTPEPVEVDDKIPTNAAGSDGFTDVLAEQWQFASLLQRLPREESDLLRARFYAGRSQQEIAAETGIPLGTVKMRMVQGLERLRELLDEEGQDA